MAYYTSTDILLSEILEKNTKASEGSFPSWTGKAWSGSGTTFNAIPGGNIEATYSASKYPYAEEMVYVFPSNLEYTLPAAYVSTDDLLQSNLSSILTDVATAYLAVSGGGVAYMRIKKIDFETMFVGAGKYRVAYKISFELWYT
jgi:hypothetical protein